MQSLYSITKRQKAIRELAKAMVGISGNMPRLLDVFPDFASEISTDGSLMIKIQNRKLMDKINWQRL